MTKVKLALRKLLKKPKARKTLLYHYIMYSPIFILCGSKKDGVPDTQDAALSSGGPFQPQVTATEKKWCNIWPIRRSLLIYNTLRTPQVTTAILPFRFILLCSLCRINNAFILYSGRYSSGDTKYMYFFFVKNKTFCKVFFGLLLLWISFLFFSSILHLIVWPCGLTNGVTKGTTSLCISN